MGVWTHGRVDVCATSDALDDRRHALTDADAHRAQRVSSVSQLELARRREQQARARHSEWVAKRDRAAVRVDAWIVVGDAELAQTCQRLRGERLVQFDD